LLLVTFVVFKGLKQPEIFSGIEYKPVKQKYAKTALPKEKMDTYLKKLIHLMEKDKPYMDRSLNINSLAEMLSIPSHYVSQILNCCLDQNFYQFINSYRIYASKKALADKFNNNKTILDVLYESGFNSKASFNRIFKQYTGMTLSEFIKTQKEKYSFFLIDGYSFFCVRWMGAPPYGWNMYAFHI